MTLTPTSIASGPSELLSANCGGCLLNAACTYMIGASVGTNRGPEPTRDTTRDIAHILVPSYSISAIGQTKGQCYTILGSAVTLETAFSLDVRSTMSGLSLSESVASEIVNFLGNTDCFYNIQIVTPSVSATLKATVTPGSKDLNSVSPTTLSPIRSFPIPTAAATETQKGISRTDKIRIAVGVIFSVLGFLAVISGILLVLRHRRKARLVKQKPNEHDNAETRQSAFFHKPELDAQQSRHELEAEKDRCELEGDSNRQEMAAQEVDDDARGKGDPQELRGIEPSHEMEAHEESVVPI